MDTIRSKAISEQPKNSSDIINPKGRHHCIVLDRIMKVCEVFKQSSTSVVTLFCHYVCLLSTVDIKDSPPTPKEPRHSLRHRKEIVLASAKVINNFQSAKQFGKKNENEVNVFVHGNKKAAEVCR